MLLVGGSAAEAEHVLEAEHQSQAVVRAGDPLVVRIAAATSCVVAPVCSWVQAQVRYERPDGEAASVWVEGPYQPFQVLAVTVPGEHVNSPTFSYEIDVSQQACFDRCHGVGVHLPRVLETYTVEVVDV
jgi:hypothetical protein